MVDHATLVTAVANLAWGEDGTMSNFTKVEEIRDMLLKLEDANAGTDIDPILDGVMFSDETDFFLLLADLGIKGFHSCKVDLQAMESNKKAQWEEWLDGDCSFMELENKLTELLEGSKGTGPASRTPPPPPHTRLPHTHIQLRVRLTNVYPSCRGAMAPEPPP